MSRPCASSSAPPVQMKPRRKSVWQRLRADWVLYAMLFPTLLYFVLFRVLPILNMRLAFFTFKAKGPWVYVGAKYFKQSSGKFSGIR